LNNAGLQQKQEKQFYDSCGIIACS